ncbi:hypothetical protein [Salisediminibacterium selenitireducens]|uniref:Uncharacterized protein n=1 Tax=Bacillus selenitireducens (strain ATCC 700615 / DSM 15326 / MLS10) TaxID=439292 RepID=D6XSH4_BACIE|nr:hypothetical protein [Salisediminibacterium selenitireducens]ADH98760.1 hypothetical protein Bsel_1248 [[Bacillus] selenitireducens MLS10]
MNRYRTGTRTIMIRRAFDWTGQTGYEAWTKEHASIFAPVIGLLIRDLQELSVIRDGETILWQIEAPMEAEEMNAINDEVRAFKFE